MKLFTSLTSALWLGFATFSFTQAGPLASRASGPPPTRPFTVSAYESPYPVGTGLTGYNLTARNGNLYLSPKANVQKAVLFVDGQGKAYLDSKNPQPIYIDTSTGLLAYKTPAPPGALFVDFVHLGHGTSVFYQGNGFTSLAPGTFVTLLASGSWWSACGTSGNEYQVYTSVSVFGGTPDTASCKTVSLSALDYSGPNPAVDSYS